MESFPRCLLAHSVPPFSSAHYPFRSSQIVFLLWVSSYIQGMIITLAKSQFGDLWGLETFCVDSESPANPDVFNKSLVTDHCHDFKSVFMSKLNLPYKLTILMKTYSHSL